MALKKIAEAYPWAAEVGADVVVYQWDHGQRTVYDAKVLRVTATRVIAGYTAKRYHGNELRDVGVEHAFNAGQWDTDLRVVRQRDSWSGSYDSYLLSPEDSRVKEIREEMAVREFLASKKVMDATVAAEKATSQVWINRRLWHRRPDVATLKEMRADILGAVDYLDQLDDLIAKKLEKMGKLDG